LQTLRQAQLSAGQEVLRGLWLWPKLENPLVQVADKNFAGAQEKTMEASQEDSHLVKLVKRGNCWAGF